MTPDSDATRYRARAEECRVLAEGTKDADMRNSLFLAAEGWDDMARRAEAARKECGNGG